MKIVAKALIQDKDGSILLLQRSATHPNFPEHVDFPGGEVELNESHVEAIQREIWEETGLSVPLESLELVFQKHISEDLLHVVAMAKMSEVQPAIELSWEHSGFEWKTLADFMSTPPPENADGYHLTMLDFFK